MKFLFRLWQKLPLWVHILASRMIRPRYRVAVAAMVFNEQGQILLFRHTYRKFEWGIPAGSLEYGEEPERAIVREFMEEAGIQIRVKKLLLAESAKNDHHVTLIYLCAVELGTFRESAEISEIRYFPVDALPPMLFAEKDLIRNVARMRLADNNL
jgi:ADP-ribose pyrophosphatase YjhB (NUDIX family)